MTNHHLPVLSNESHETEAEPRRRDLPLLVIGWIGTVGAFLAATAAALRGLVPNLLNEPNLRYRAGNPDNFLVNQVSFIDEIRVFLIRKGNSFRAMSGVCTHLGCTVNRATGSRGGYHCPCHGSVFDDEGRVVSGPAPSPLPSYQVTMSRDERLVIDRERVVSADQYLVLDVEGAPTSDLEST